MAPTPRPPFRRAALLPALVAGAALLFPAPLDAQQAASERPEAAPADVASPGAIVAAAYDAISGAAGEARDWDRLRSLFLPEGRMIPAFRDSAGAAAYRVLTVEEYIEAGREAFAEEGFYEREIWADTRRFGDIAHVFSTYESRRSPDAEPFTRGINSFQLWFDGDRWWIVDIFWHAEREDAPIPERYGG